jgi:uncharacterized protein
MFLVDTNLWLELLLEQEKAEEVHQFLESVDAHQLSMTEFTLYSIGLITIRLGEESIFEVFISDILEESAVRKISLSTFDLKKVFPARKEFHLDFDDVYQYVAEKRDGLILVSFDSDFDKTDIGRRTPADLSAAMET